MPILNKRAMNTPLHRCSAPLLLFGVLAAIPAGYGQVRDHAFMTNEGRAAYWAGRYEEAETLLRGA